MHESQYLYSHIEFANSKLSKKVNKDTGFVHDFSFYASGKHLEYITRKSAIYIQDDNLTKQALKNEFDISNLDFKSYLNSKTYENQALENINLENKTGLYRLFSDEPIDLSIEKEKQLLKRINKNQNIWEMIINPGEIGITNFSMDKNEWNDILNFRLSKLVQYNGLDPNNLLGHWVIHANTNYPHIHLSFWEKTPNNKNKFKQKGAFSKSSVTKFNELLYQDLTKNGEYLDLFKSKNSIWDMRKDLKKMFEFGPKYFEITSAVSIIKNFYENKSNHNYATSLDDEQVNKAIWNIFDFVKNYNNAFSHKYDRYQKEIDLLKNKDFKDTFNSKLRDEFIEKETNEFKNQIGNIIVKICLSNNGSNLPNVHLNSDYSYSGLNYLIRKWIYESNGILFNKKIQALKKFRETKYRRMTNE